ncbi:YccS family putative transporter [Alysiella sp.]|uniref:YccS family putative transporter n=1 Tax=Alysiella sp. TaxID=1872483 RepID=UPI0026DB5A48|nr:YccS family putative transporter [Alysiella sp.]
MCSAVYVYSWQAYFSPLILGIIAGGLVDLDNGLTGKLKNLFFTLMAFAIASLAVQIANNHPIQLTLTYITLAFIFTFLGAAGNRYRTIAFGTLVVSVYTTLSYDAKAPLYLNSALILLGTLLYSIAALLTHIAFPHRPVQEKMATAYDSLARYFDAKAELFDPDEADFLEQQHLRFAMSNNQVIAAFNQCRAALFYRMRGQHRHPRTTRMLRFYFIAQDIHERISSSHVHYKAFAEQMRYTDLIFRIRRLLRLQAAAARRFAHSLRDHSDYVADDILSRATQGAEQSLQRYAAQHQNDTEGIAPYRIQRLLDNITHVSRQFAHLGNPYTEDWEHNSNKTRIQAPEVSGLKNAWRSLKKHATLQSAVFRHAVRMGLVALVCCLLVQTVSVLHLQQTDVHLGFWTLLTAIFVCQPNYSATQKRLIQRIIGTFCGVLVGSVLPVFALTLAQKLGIAAISTTLFFLFRTSKHSFSTFFITIQAIMGFSIMGYDVTAFFMPRMMDTLIGAAVAGAAAYFLWPDWRYVSLDKAAREAVESNGGYLKAVLDELQEGLRDDLDYRIARRNSHDKAAALSSVLSDMSSEAEKHGKRVQEGFLILKINYSLISYIAALGAYRDKMHASDDDFLMSFFAAAQGIAALLQVMSQLNETDFQAAHLDLQQQLNQMREIVSSSSNDDPQNPTLWQQLLMMHELLPACYQALAIATEKNVT